MDCGLPLTYIFMDLWSATEMCVHGIETFHWNVLILPVAILIKKTDSPFPAAISCPQLIDYVKGFIFISCLYAGICLDWISIRLVHSVSTISVGFCLLCLVTLYPCIHSLPPAVTVILCSLLQWSLSLEKRGCNINFPLKTKL